MQGNYGNYHNPVVNKTLQRFDEESSSDIEDELETVAAQVHGLGNRISAQQEELPFVLLSNPLSYFYTQHHLKSNCGCTLVATPFLYPIGMIGYLCSLPVRIVIFVIACLGSLYCFACIKNDDHWKALKPHLIFTAGALGELISGAIGCGCPILAYKLDALIQGDRTVHEIYLEKGLSVSSRDFTSSEDFQNNPYLRRLVSFMFNEKQIVQKEEEAEHFKPYLKQAAACLLEVEELKDDIDNQLDTDSLITFGIFLACVQEAKLDQLIDNIVARKSMATRRSVRETLEGYIEAFKAKYKYLETDGWSEEEIEQLMIEAIIANKKDNNLVSEGKAIYKPLHNFRGWLSTNDKTMDIFLLMKAYEKQEDASD